jgi:Transglycosylase-like domain
MWSTGVLVSDSSASEEERLHRNYLRLDREARDTGAAPGRNVLLRSFDTGDGRVRAAGNAELRRSVPILERTTGPAAEGGRAPAARASTTNPTLEAIAACESGGDPTDVGGGGLYRGKYQFSYETWQSVGGTGDPAAAPEAEQDRRAAMLLARDGAGHWPACGG